MQSVLRVLRLLPYALAHKELWALLRCFARDLRRAA